MEDWKVVSQAISCTNLDITYGLQVVESSSLVSVLFRETFFSVTNRSFLVSVHMRFLHDPCGNAHKIYIIGSYSLEVLDIFFSFTSTNVLGYKKCFGHAPKMILYLDI